MCIYQFLHPVNAYPDYHTYQLRVYLYQARYMYTSNNELPDPYACVSCTRYSACSCVVRKSICPTWDETLMIQCIRLFGHPDSIVESPPPVNFEFFDKDNIVSLLARIFNGRTCTF